MREWGEGVTRIIRVVHSKYSQRHLNVQFFGEINLDTHTKAGNIIHDKACGTRDGTESAAFTEPVVRASVGAFSTTPHSLLQLLIIMIIVRKQ